MDIGAQYQDIRRIIMAHFCGWILRSGLDPDDTVQEVCAILLAKRGRAAYDPGRSAWPHYVYVVARSAIASMARNEARRRARVVTAPDPERCALGACAQSSDYRTGKAGVRR
jgi:DNA-directed RNA polymerase specialized sigma24 family protein